MVGSSGIISLVSMEKRPGLGVPDRVVPTGRASIKRLGVEGKYAAESNRVTGDRAPCGGSMLQGAQIIRVGTGEKNVHRRG